MSRRDVITHPRALPLVAPSVLAADFARLGEECRTVMEGGADLLHVDVMDGHFVPNLTMGPDHCAALRRAVPDACLDVHLMVTDPDAFLEPFAAAGADHLTFHVEAHDDPPALARRVREAGLTVGLAVNPPTPVEAVLPYVEAFDLLLVMSVNPGFAGQAFIPSVLEKTRALAPVLRADQRLEMDGGVGTRTAPDCRRAGCDLLVAGSAVFGTADRAAAIAAIRGTVPAAVAIDERRGEIG